MDEHRRREQESIALRPLSTAPTAISVRLRLVPMLAAESAPCWRCGAVWRCADQEDTRLVASGRRVFIRCICGQQHELKPVRGGSADDRLARYVRC